MVHGSCGSINNKYPCMKDGKWKKRFPKQFLLHTQHDGEGYPNCRRRSEEDGGNTFDIQLRGNKFTVDNRWIVPYCPLLSKIFKAHINVEFCNYVSSIKYICKYINKGSDMSRSSCIRGPKLNLRSF